MCLLGLTDKQLAEFFGVSAETLYAWKASYPEFREAISLGKQEADAEVANSLLERATGRARAVRMAVFLPRGATEPLFVPYVEGSLPDVGAAKMWLANRQPDRWRERRGPDLTPTLEQRIGAMTPQERLQRLAELQAKASQSD